MDIRCRQPTLVQVGVTVGERLPRTQPGRHVHAES